MRPTVLVAAAVLVLGSAVATPASAATSGSLTAAQRRANQAAGRLSQAEADLARAQARADRLQQRVVATRNKMAALAASVQDTAIRQYVFSGVRIPLVLDDDIGATVRADELARFVTGRALDTLAHYRATREDLDTATAALTRQLAQQRAAVALLRRERSAAAAEVARLARLARQSGRATATRTRVTGVIVGTGDWLCPVAGPHAFSNDFGDPRPGGRLHQGVDILAPRGTPVVASVSGVVSDHPNALGGLGYFLAGSDGNTYYGAHLAGYAASGSVAKGTVVGYVGNTGDAAGGPPHLHFEIHPGGGAAVNPYPTLVRYC